MGKDMEQTASFFAVQNHGEGLYSFTAPMGEQIHLVIGKNQGLVIDTGIGIGALSSAVESITPLPLTVVNTHGHPDHAGGNIEFETCLMHSWDAPHYSAMCTRAYRLQDLHTLYGDTKPEWEGLLLDMAPEPDPILDGAVLELGDRDVQVFHTPGHTSGSLCLYDEQSGSLFASDMLSGEAVWMYDQYSEPLQVYHDSLCRLRQTLPDIRQIFIGHLPGRLPAETLDHHLECAFRILRGKAQGQLHRTFAGEGLLYQWKNAGIVYNPNRLTR